MVTTMLGQQGLHDSGNWNTRSILIHFLFLSHMKGFSLPSNWLYRIGLFKILVGIDFFSFWFGSCKLWLVPTKQYRIADNCYRVIAIANPASIGSQPNIPTPKKGTKIPPAIGINPAL